MNFQESAGKYKSELLDNVLPFWLEHSQDRQCGGYFSCLGRDDGGRHHVPPQFVDASPRNVITRMEASVIE